MYRITSRIYIACKQHCHANNIAMQTTLTCKQHCHANNIAMQTRADTDGVTASRNAHPSQSVRVFPKSALTTSICPVWIPSCSGVDLRGKTACDSEQPLTARPFASLI
jgi:hypothetical protein